VHSARGAEYSRVDSPQHSAEDPIGGVARVQAEKQIAGGSIDGTCPALAKRQRPSCAGVAWRGQERAEAVASDVAHADGRVRDGRPEPVATNAWRKKGEAAGN
jgi:hypothetical protein